MITGKNQDSTIYKVVVDHEEQHSISPDARENPVGWKDAGKLGMKAECLAYIKEVWADMRPLRVCEKIADRPSTNSGRTEERVKSLENFRSC